MNDASTREVTNPSDAFINHVNGIFGQYKNDTESVPMANKTSGNSKPQGKNCNQHKNSTDVSAIFDETVVNDEDIAYMKKIGMQIPGQTPVENLLAVPDDFKANPPHSRSGPAATVTKLCDRLSTKYRPGKTYRVEDLLQINHDYACRALCGIVNAVVEDVKDVFFWQDGTKPYAPNITFVLKENAVLRHDECGWFYNPAALVFNDDILAQCGFYPKGVKTGAIWGRFAASPDEPRGGSVFFQPTSDVDATDLLLVTKWGGPNSTTRGTDQETIRSLLPEGALKYFEKCSSQKGGLGYDYVVLSLVAKPKLRNVIHCAEMQRRSVFDQREALYYQKLQLIDIIKDKNPAVDTFVDTTNRQLNALCERCARNPITARPFVYAPDIQFIENPEMSPTPHLTLSKLTELAAKQDRMISESSNYLLRTELRVKAWETFAPEFLKAERIVHGLYGWLTIYGDYVAVTLPSQNSETMQTTKKYVFSAEGLHTYLSDLCLRQGDHEHWCRACQQQLKELLSAENMERLRQPFETNDADTATVPEDQSQSGATGETSTASSDGNTSVDVKAEGPDANDGSPAVQPDGFGE